MQFITPLAFLGALLAIPILLLYMLRLRRREVVISSTFLWSQVLRDREANTPWQRLKRNFLLLLQLLILAALILALARPYMLVPAVRGGQIALLLDASASMNANDGVDGETRFDEAKRRAREIIDTLNPDSQMTLMRVGETAEVLTPYSSDQTLLLGALDGALPGYAGANWDAALTLAAASASGSDDFTTILISDGGSILRNEAGTPGLPTIPGELEYVPVGQSGENIAISALAARALPGALPQLFAQITNYGGRDAEVIFDLRADGELLVAQRETIPANGSISISDIELPARFTTIEAGLTAPAADAANFPDRLLDDNRAAAVAPSAGARRVLLLTEGNLFLEQVLRSLPGLDVVVGDPAASGFGTYDLIVLDGVLPTGLPDTDLLIVDPPTSGAFFTLGAERADSEQPNPAANIRVRREDPRMTFVDLTNVSLRVFREIDAPGFETLIEADGGALLVVGEADGRQIAVMPFDLRDSDLPLQISFPILIASLIDSFTPRALLTGDGAYQAGDFVTFTLPPNATAARVSLPDGTTQTIPAQGLLPAFTGTEILGLYRIEALEGETVLETAAFAVNLFDAAESTLAPNPTAQVGGASLDEAVREAVGQREFWTWLALAALVILMIEWFAYHRRQLPGGRGRTSSLFHPLARRTT